MCVFVFMLIVFIKFIKRIALLHCNRSAHVTTDMFIKATSANAPRNGPRTEYCTTNNEYNVMNWHYIYLHKLIYSI